LQIGSARLGQMSFLSTKEQCRSTEGMAVRNYQVQTVDISYQYCWTFLLIYCSSFNFQPIQWQFTNAVKWVNLWLLSGILSPDCSYPICPQCDDGKRHQNIYFHRIQNSVQNVIITLVNPLTSSSIFNVFTDMFITKLKLLDAGCRIGFTYIGCVLYADNITLLSPSVYGL